MLARGVQARLQQKSAGIEYPAYFVLTFEFFWAAHLL